MNAQNVDAKLAGSINKSFMESVVHFADQNMII
jgi:hypothetical protein